MKLVRIGFIARAIALTQAAVKSIRFVLTTDLPLCSLTSLIFPFPFLAMDELPKHQAATGLASCVNLFSLSSTSVILSGSVKLINVWGISTQVTPAVSKRCNNIAANARSASSSTTLYNLHSSKIRSSTRL